MHSNSLRFVVKWTVNKQIIIFEFQCWQNDFVLLRLTCSIIRGISSLENWRKRFWRSHWLLCFVSALPANNCPHLSLECVPASIVSLVLIRTFCLVNIAITDMVRQFFRCVLMGWASYWTNYKNVNFYSLGTTELFVEGLLLYHVCASVIQLMDQMGFSWDAFLHSGWCLK